MGGASCRGPSKLSGSLGVWKGSPTGGRGTGVGSQEWESQKCSDFGVTNLPTQPKVPDLQYLLHSMQLAQALLGQQLGT